LARRRRESDPKWEELYVFNIWPMPGGSRATFRHRLVKHPTFGIRHDLRVYDADGHWTSKGSVITHEVWRDMIADSAVEKKVATEIKYLNVASRSTVTADVQRLKLAEKLKAERQLDARVTRFFVDKAEPVKQSEVIEAIGGKRAGVIAELNRQHRAKSLVRSGKGSSRHPYFWRKSK
jgi:hypothetical protein